MIDKTDIVVISGSGGNGNISGRREKYVPKGGPDGGDGGDGGSVILRANRNINTLVEFRYRRRFEAPSGGPGLPALKHGANGKNVVVSVPVGTQIHELSEDGSPGIVLFDLDDHGREVIVASGGSGGRGNASYANSVNQFPMLAEAGEAGEERALRLELKLIADVGLVGLPNAGKSSLLRAVSAARPKVASYPFTTLEPVLGVVEHRGSEFLMVDIPGLIEGAHEGVGLGHDFLRHIERTRVLIHVIDASLDDPLADSDQIEREMAMFDERLSQKTRVVVLNKMDIAEAAEKADELEKALKARGLKVIRTSAAARTGLTKLLDLVVLVLEKEDPAGEAPPTLAERLAGTGKKKKPLRKVPKAPVLGGVQIIRPLPVNRRSSVTLKDGVFVIESLKAARMATMVNPENWEAKSQFYGHLRKLGIVQKLEDLGIKTGDTVQLGDTEWEWS
jgi:GTP-binding protein